MRRLRERLDDETIDELGGAVVLAGAILLLAWLPAFL